MDQGTAVALLVSLLLSHAHTYTYTPGYCSPCLIANDAEEDLFQLVAIPCWIEALDVDGEACFFGVCVEPNMSWCVGWGGEGLWCIKYGRFVHVYVGFRCELVCVVSGP